MNAPMPKNTLPKFEAAAGIPLEEHHGDQGVPQVHAHGADTQHDAGQDGASVRSGRNEQVDGQGSQQETGDRDRPVAEHVDQRTEGQHHKDAREHQRGNQLAEPGISDLQLLDQLQLQRADYGKGDTKTEHTEQRNDLNHFRSLSRIGGGNATLARDRIRARQFYCTCL